MPRKQYKYHFIYKTTCLVNEKFYYGMHSTFNLDDGYIGSGTRLWHSINKHGRENFNMEILEFLPDRKALVAREKEIITEEMLQDPMCMNLQPGGGGGFCSEEHRIKCQSAGTIAAVKSGKNMKTLKFLHENNKDWLNSKKEKMSNSLKGKVSPFKGKTHTNEYKEMISKVNSNKQRGEGNSQFGKCWIYNKTNSISIKKDQLENYLKEGWLIGRKLKFEN